VPARYVIGLTGNIGSGKSVVSGMLADLGADVIDADQVARDVLDRGSPELETVLDRFGRGLLRADGTLDRPALGRIVFDDRDALADLESIVHPATRTRIFDRLERSEARVAVIEAIKLLEGPLADHVDAVWVVTAPANTRVDRLVRQRGLESADARQRVEAQNPEEEKVRRADVVLRNDGSLEELREQVRNAWRRSGLGVGG
jgi:dephospho-CoA kinase